MLNSLQILLVFEHTAYALPYFKLFRTDPQRDRGFGVVTLVDINKGEFIAEYRVKSILHKFHIAHDSNESLLIPA